MNIKWKKLIVQLGFWISLEILFNQVGLDTIADYSEFIFEKDLITLV
ncbi:hypothetical protein NIES4102_25930 [Chondrocystis sp. NIES-4102]|nr:hypothetical protein NIES4102_25930 [Chondrocystis sp. NIES-4102]